MNRFEWQSLILSADGPASPTVRLVCCAVGKHLNADGVCWPSVGRLAECTGLSERAVQSGLSEAEASGWVVRETKPGRVTRYHSSTPAGRAPVQEVHPTPAPGAPGGEPPAGVGVQEIRGRGAGGAPELFKEGRKEEPSKEGGEAPSCPSCSSSMEKKKPRNGAPPFWGCSAFKITGCKGKAEVDDRPSAQEATRATAHAMAVVRSTPSEPIPVKLLVAQEQLKAATRRGDKLAAARAEAAIEAETKRLKPGRAG